MELIWVHNNLRWVIKKNTVRTIAQFVSKPVLRGKVNELYNQFSLGLLFRFDCKQFRSEQRSARCLDFCKLCSVCCLLLFCLSFRRIDGLYSIKSNWFNKLCWGNSWEFFFVSAHRILLNLCLLVFVIAAELCRSHGQAVLFNDLSASCLLGWVSSCLLGMVKAVCAHFLCCKVARTHLSHY